VGVGFCKSLSRTGIIRFLGEDYRVIDILPGHALDRERGETELVTLSGERNIRIRSDRITDFEAVP